jgi:hypothetical protein
VPRRFNSALLKALLDGEAADAGELFEEFGRLPFVEDVTRPGEGPSRTWLRVHNYVRAGLLDQVVRMDAPHFDVLHDRAARFHSDKVVDETAAVPYGEAFACERPEWQHHKREWLYHRAHAQNEAVRRQALLECARVFLEAFWWWGNYVHFDFCDQLVSDLGHMVRLDGDRGATWDGLVKLEDGLRRLLVAYPPRSGKHAGNWDLVENALLQVQSACGVARGKPASDVEAKVRALLKTFLAHTCRYRDVPDPRADEYYRAAEAGFRAVGEYWSTAWVLAERAGLRFEQGHVDDEFRDLWLAAAGMVQSPPGSDNEPLAPEEENAANLHRLRGDACSLQGDHLRAATWYRRAVLHAYLFHDAGDRPDEYTLQFYVDIRARALNRLVELVAKGDLDGALACAVELGNVQTDTDTGAAAPDPDELARQLSGAIEPVPLAAALFPRGPHVEELVPTATEFSAEVDRRSERVKWDVVAHDLHDEQWP